MNECVGFVFSVKDIIWAIQSKLYLSPPVRRWHPISETTLHCLLDEGSIIVMF